VDFLRGLLIRYPFATQPVAARGIAGWHGKERSEAVAEKIIGENTKLFERQQPREKRRLLNFVLSNCSWEDGEVIANFRQPFDLLAQTTAIATRAATRSDSNLAKSEIWLPFLDTFEPCAEPQSQL
jgi:hypothetical protein